jgi:hypothetical protein
LFFLSLQYDGGKKLKKLDSSMAGVTDIPDWTANEVGLEYGWLNAGPAAYQTMWDRSPIAHVDSVTAPVFLMIGECIGRFSVVFTSVAHPNPNDPYVFEPPRSGSISQRY